MIKASIDNVVFVNCHKDIKNGFGSIWNKRFIQKKKYIYIFYKTRGLN